MATVSFQFPLWTIGGPEFKVSSLSYAKNQDGKNMALLFTSEPAAREFADSCQELARTVPRAIHDPVHLFGFAVLLEKEGYAGAFFDHPPLSQGSSPAAINVIAIAELREVARGGCI